MKKVPFNYDEVTLLEMSYLLSNYNGYLDADKQQLIIDL